MSVRAALLSALCLAGCESGGYVQRKEPTPEDRELREIFIRGQTNLDPILVRQLRAFRIEPEDALRRQSYVDARPKLQPGLRRDILGGYVIIRMSDEHVQATWGEPDGIERPADRGGVTEIWLYARPAGKYHRTAMMTRLTFERGSLIDIRESSR